MYERIKKWYKQNLWTKEMVQNAVDKGILTTEQVVKILASK